MSVQDIIFSASGGSSTTSSIEYAVGVYDLPITANWSAIVYTGEKTVIVGDNKFVTITDPADQSTMVYGDLPANVRTIANKLACINQTILIPGRRSKVGWPGYAILSLDGGTTWSNSEYATFTDASYTYEPVDITPLRNKTRFNVRVFSMNQYNTYGKTALLNISPPTIVSKTSPDAAITKQTASDEVNGVTDFSPKSVKHYPYLPKTITPINVGKNSYAKGTLNGVDTYAFIGNDGFLYESTNGTTYTKNTTTVIPTGTYLDITFAGGKFCAPIANTNKFVVIG